MSYRPREFWERRLAEQFDLRGTGETGLSLAYNRACYVLRAEVLARALAAARFEPAGASVLDVGCGTGFFVEYYLRRGARVTGVDIAATSVERLRAGFPQASFVLADVSEAEIGGRFDLVNAFDVLYHIVEDARWEAAVRRLGEAVRPGGLLLVTDTFVATPPGATHNRMRALDEYRRVLEPLGFATERTWPTHALLNRDLGPWRFLNRAPGLLLGIDRALLALGLGELRVTNRLLVARRGEGRGSR
ncbi:MAG TPA: class I SAM-dependent methyltransferase [Terriglobales bacterium]|nr:class I SAM-dependent methyltransferase [Terriglobales bacterium]